MVGAIRYTLIEELVGSQAEGQINATLIGLH
jgi:hypothetical protein